MIERIQQCQQASARVLNFLRCTDACAVSNAIETFNVRMRSEGFIVGTAECQFPKLPPVVGYAVTARIRTSAPPIANLCYYHRVDWWDYVASFPSPKVIVVHDVDPIPGTGAFVGKALGCIAYVTNGTIRNVSALEAAQFQCFASGKSTSHSYAHIIEFGEPVEIGGLKVSSGDLLHGDCHGVHAIPFSIVEGLPEAVQSITDREADLISCCQSPDFSLEKLTAILNREIPVCQPIDRR
jgi:regulator of RNase E activity RraA